MADEKEIVVKDGNTELTMSQIQKMCEEGQTYLIELRKKPDLSEAVKELIDKYLPNILQKSVEAGDLNCLAGLALHPKLPEDLRKDLPRLVGIAVGNVPYEASSDALSQSSVVYSPVPSAVLLTVVPNLESEVRAKLKTLLARDVEVFLLNPLRAEGHILPIFRSNCSEEVKETVWSAIVTFSNRIDEKTKGATHLRYELAGKYGGTIVHIPTFISSLMNSVRSAGFDFPGRKKTEPNSHTKRQEKGKATNGVN